MEYPGITRHWILVAYKKLTCQGVFYEGSLVNEILNIGVKCMNENADQASFTMLQQKRSKAKEPLIWYSRKVSNVSLTVHSDVSVTIPRKKTHICFITIAKRCGFKAARAPILKVILKKRFLQLRNIVFCLHAFPQIQDHFAL